MTIGSGLLNTEYVGLESKNNKEYKFETYLFSPALSALILLWKGVKYKKNMNTIKKGFTLIELLIVIAILGVLAVVVLVAINPVQQLARGRDSGRMSSIAQIGHAVEAFYVSHDATYPTSLTELSNAGEISTIPSEVTNATGNGVCTGAPDNGWCLLTGTNNFVVYTKLEADTNEDAGGCSDDGAYFVYSSTSGNSCINCAVPAATFSCP